MAKTFYACGVDWQYEMGEAADLEGKMPLYSSVEELTSKCTCWKQCGIVKLTLTLDSWVMEQNLFGKDEEE